MYTYDTLSRLGRRLPAQAARALVALHIGFASTASAQSAPLLWQASTTVWGVADLHAHPAMHLAFGPENGDALFWGRPGIALVADTMAEDLAPCMPGRHAPSFDLLKDRTREALLTELHALHGSADGASGWPHFTDWPHALSVAHQQMHVEWVHRAYQGGVRLMVASVTDNQLLDHIFDTSWVAAKSQHFGQPADDADDRSARRQLDFIEAMAAANDWMEIARTPEDARRAIRNGKLAVILSLEMDTLSSEQVLGLVNDYGVGLVTPIHFADNDYGGAAVVADLFNRNNFFLNGRWYDVAGDPFVAARLTSGEGEFAMGMEAYCASGYGTADECPSASRTIEGSLGHRNALGLRDDELIIDLMKAGVLIDLAHMSQRSVERVLELAEERGVPLVSSHTGLRRSGVQEGSERELRDDHVRRIARLSGVIGLGTARRPSPLRQGGDWLDDFAQAVALLGHGRVALGTDFNGLQAQIDRVEGWGPSYPIVVGRRFGGRVTPLPQRRDGNRTFSVVGDGLAHYGMIPDFLDAVDRNDGHQDRLAPLFRSAEATLRAWDRARRVARRL